MTDDAGADDATLDDAGADDAVTEATSSADRERLGKVDRAFFTDHIADRLGATRTDVRLGPAHGVDFGVIEAGETPVVAATDPISMLRELGDERAGRFAVRFALADVAVSGVAPTHVLPSFALPTDLSDEAFAAFWRGMTDVCREEGVAVVGGHTARYPGASMPWIGAATVLGVGNASDAVIRPDGARPGDRLIVTEGPGIETAGVFTTLFPAAFDALDPETVAAAQACLDRTGVTRAVRIATRAASGTDAAGSADAGSTANAEGAADATDANRGITAMHDATEGGLRGALCETAEASGVRFDVDRSAVPERPAAIAACEAVGIDPWATTTAGTLILTASPAVADRVVDALRDANVPAAVAGRVAAGEGVYLDNERVHPPAEDASWAAYARLSGAD